MEVAARIQLTAGTTWALAEVDGEEPSLTLILNLPTGRGTPAALETRLT